MLNGVCAIMAIQKVSRQHNTPYDTFHEVRTCRIRMLLCLSVSLVPCSVGLE